MTTLASSAHDRLSPQAPHHRPRHAGAGLDGGVRRAGDSPRRPGAADAGHERQRRPGRTAAQPDGSQRATCLALSALGRRPAQPRFRPLLHLFGAGHRSRARTACRLAAAGADRARALHHHRHPGRPVFRQPARPGRRHDGDGCRAAWRRRAQFLVRADADLCLRRLAAAGAGRRLSRLERRRLAGAEIAAAAGGGACLAAGGDPGARHPLGADRGAERGLYPHRPRQGPALPRRACGGTRCATP